MDVRALVGINVLRLRRDRGLTQLELSLQSGFTRAYLSGLEAGKRNPRLLSLDRLAASLGVTVEDLVRRPQVAAERARRIAGSSGDRESPP
ncbi:DNA-binding transcriptional regulator, XRE-family HTH domain [Chelatococcus sambhunathii]|uniref:DNA-binding transcriptional regulator, XRE-family HTH domain n=1 Tax=Chelatococcus sambhunathii TaxID=363953 RepID=A0ABP2A5Q1_9HYPH|nr:helix-turn-helix transcriptional regulator [Chelatococcus sambhunathii]CUA89251.1 DNA-binding transcriptional regulator, XRE-family HTH domain [Chelatococcus sambhunathii]